MPRARYHLHHLLPSLSLLLSSSLNGASIPFSFIFLLISSLPNLNIRATLRSGARGGEELRRGLDRGQEDHVRLRDAHGLPRQPQIPRFLPHIGDRGLRLLPHMRRHNTLVIFLFTLSWFIILNIALRYCINYAYTTC